MFKNLRILSAGFIFGVLSIAHGTSVAATATEGDVLSSNLELGFGRFLTLPKGEWRVVKVSNLWGNNSSHKGFVLRSVQAGQVPLIVVVSSSTPNYWNNSFLALPRLKTELLGVREYETTSSSVITKQSFYFDLEASDYGYQSHWSDPLRIKDFMKEYSDRSFYVGVTRNISRTEDIRIISFIKKPLAFVNGSQLSGADLKISDFNSAVLRWNSVLVEASAASYYDKRKETPSYSFEYDEQFLINAYVKRLEEERLAKARAERVESERRAQAAEAEKLKSIAVEKAELERRLRLEAETKAKSASAEKVENERRLRAEAETKAGSAAAERAEQERRIQLEAESRSRAAAVERVEQERRKKPIVVDSVMDL